MNARTSHDRSVVPNWVRIGGTRWVSIRPIEHADASGLFDFYSRLSAESRRRRFLNGGSPPPTVVERLADAAGFVGILRESGPRDGAIVAHASLQPDAAGSAEVAFAVADDVQGYGLGTRLVAMLLDLARRSRLERVMATTSVENAGMRHLLATAGLPIVADRIECGAEEIVLELGATQPRAA